jgi:hypothetical protein
MVVPERFLADGQRAAEQRDCLAKPPLGFVQARQAVQAVRHVGMGAAQPHLADREGLLKQRLGFGELAFKQVQVRQTRETRSAHQVWLQLTFGLLDGELVKRLGFAVAASFKRVSGFSKVTWVHDGFHQRSRCRSPSPPRFLAQEPVKHEPLHKVCQKRLC